MILTRRDTLILSMAGIAGAALPPFPAAAQTQGDRYAAEGGDIVIRPIQHASFALTTPAGVTIYNDPVGGAALYEGQPRPDLILISHEHGDHFDPGTLAGIVSDGTKLVTNPSVHDKLPDDLKAAATALGNGDSTTVGEVQIDAIPAYNMTEDRKQYHPQGRDNGYVLTLAGKRVYVAGDTEDIPEMRTLTGIMVAFVPMNLPYTMSVDQAVDGVAAFAPEYVYPYHYRGSDPKEFADKLAAKGAATRVVMGPWYES